MPVRLASTAWTNVAGDWLVVAQPEGFEGGSELQTWISQVRMQAADFVAKWTGHQIDPGDVVVTSSPPKDFTTGTIVIHKKLDAGRFELPRATTPGEQHLQVSAAIFDVIHRGVALTQRSTARRYH